MKKERLIWPDNLRALATIAVILVHTAMYSRPSNILIDIVSASWARVAVPLFVLLSGALILSANFELFPFLKKRVVRVIIPFLFWSLIYAVLKLPFYKNGISLSTIWNSISWIFISFYTAKISFHLWFVYMIIGIYFFMPIIIRWLQNAKKVEVEYFLLIWIITLLIDTPFNLMYFSQFIGYSVLGYYLVTWPPKWSKWVILAIFIIGWLITSIGTYVYSIKTHSYYGYFYNYLTVNVMLMSVAVFISVKNSKINAPMFILKIRNYISKFSYGIYLVHILVLHILEHVGIRWNFITPFIGIPVTVLTCLCVSTVIIFLINKIPVAGKYISG